MRRLLYFLVLSFCIASCIPNKRLTYIQDKSFSTAYPKPIPTQRTLYRIQSNDVLSIRIQGVSQEITNTLNNSSSTAVNNSSDPGNMFLSGYSVDEAGNVTLSTIGNVMVKNLTVEEAQALIQKDVDEFYTNTTVVVKLVSFKVTVLGAVTKPGCYYIYNGQATLLDVLGLAGDLLPSGNRNTLKLIRQNSKGTEVILLDITKSDIIKSPYYYLAPNDVIYVESLKAHAVRNNLTPVVSILTVLSSTLLILSFLKIVKLN
ncbi:MAG: polysaccharide biosynthesis/export family protein [Bacteroidota bacterium]